MSNSFVARAIEELEADVEAANRSHDDYIAMGIGHLFEEARRELDLERRLAINITGGYVQWQWDGRAVWFLTNATDTPVFDHEVRSREPGIKELAEFVPAAQAIYKALQNLHANSELSYTCNVTGHEG